MKVTDRVPYSRSSRWIKSEDWDLRFLCRNECLSTLIACFFCSYLLLFDKEYHQQGRIPRVGRKIPISGPKDLAEFPGRHKLRDRMTEEEGAWLFHRSYVEITNFLFSMLLPCSKKVAFTPAPWGSWSHVPVLGSGL